MTDDNSVRWEIRPDEAPSEVVVRAVAAIQNNDPIALPTLFEVVDPDALDALVASLEGATGCVQFTYCGERVSIDCDSEVNVLVPDVGVRD